jgi:hypothetical protein
LHAAHMTIAPNTFDTEPKKKRARKMVDPWFSVGLIVGFIISAALVAIVWQPGITAKLGIVL